MIRPFGPKKATTLTLHGFEFQAVLGLKTMTDQPPHVTDFERAARRLNEMAKTDSQVAAVVPDNRVSRTIQDRTSRRSVRYSRRVACLILLETGNDTSRGHRRR